MAVVRHSPFRVSNQLMTLRNRKRWMTFVVSLVVALLLGEGILHLLDVPAKRLHVDMAMGNELVSDDDVFWTLDPGMSWANRLGLRGWVPGGEKRERDLRIACVGDSCTFGYAVSYEETYGAQLEAILRGALPAARVEVVLAGLNGYSTYQNRVLYEKRVLSLHPDITVLYCGAWNDYAGAVRESDSQFARSSKAWRRSILSASRILCLVRRVVDDWNVDLEALNRGEAPNGVRVSLEELEDNLVRLIAMGRAGGGTVIGVIPPLPAPTLRQLHRAADYLAVLRRVYSRERVPIVDSPALFANVESKLTPLWSRPPGRPSVLFIDHVHPSTDGYTIIAKALAEKIWTLSVPRVRALASQADLQTVDIQVRDPKPDRVVALSTGKDARICITGSGFRDPNTGAITIDRVFVGNRWVRKFQIGDGKHLWLQLPPKVTSRPGRHAIALVTAKGSVRSPADIRVAGMPLDVRLIDSGRYAFQATVRAAPGSRVRLWSSPWPRSQPTSTINGVLGLPGDIHGGLPDSPFFFLKANALDGLSKVDGVVAANGEWTCSGMARPAKAGEPNTRYLQAMVWVREGSNGVLTDTVKLVLGR